MADAAEFMGPVHQSALAYHEAYSTFVEVGFTPEQSFELLKLMVDLTYKS